MPGRLAPPVRHAAKSPQRRTYRRAGTVQLRPVATRVCVLHPVATTAPDPHSKTPLEAPLVDRGGCIIRAEFAACVTFFLECWRRAAGALSPRPLTASALAPRFSSPLPL